MEFLKNRWVIALGGGALVLAAALIVGWVVLAHSPKPTEPPPASQGGLVIVSGRDDDAKLDPKRPLRCFVGGQFVGELPLAVCAQRNGVATGSLDVGLDPAGALAAATNAAGSDITPLPAMQPPQSLPVIENTPSAAANAASQAPGPAPDTQPASPASDQACWRFDGSNWKRLASPMPLGPCVSALYAGQCPGAGAAYYGRWDDQTLRLIAGRVEISPDNRNFRPLVDPWPPCASSPG
jgi:hypothetical protein